jgi:hypothetical protein
MGNAQKKIAVIIRDRQAEGLRMALGLSILHNVEVYLLGSIEEPSDAIAMNIEMAGELHMGLFSDTSGVKGFEHLTYTDIAKRLLNCDNILPY